MTRRRITSSETKYLESDRIADNRSELHNQLDPPLPLCRSPPRRATSKRGKIRRKVVRLIGEEWVESLSRLFLIRRFRMVETTIVQEIVSGLKIDVGGMLDISSKRPNRQRRPFETQ